MSRGRRAITIGTLSLLMLGVFAPLASANPAVPYCLGSAAPAPRSAPTVIQPDVCEAATGRVFPEAIANPDYVAAGAKGFATDYVAFPEFEAGIKYLETKYPDYVTVIKLGDSYGLPQTPGGARDHFPVYIVEVTNKKSIMAPEAKQDLLFMLSIHGVEKGGREGGMRVIEDFVKNIGIAREKVQNGAGMPTALGLPGGKTLETYRDALDIMRLYFLFPNPDGWMHDELPYAATGGPCGGNGVLMCRTNGNGTDLNRQPPTVGYQVINPNAGRLPMNEPEPKAYIPWLVAPGHNWRYAIDIHGQLNHPNYVPVMMPAGSFTPQEMARSTRLAETLKDRLNKDPHFAAWVTACGAAAGVSVPSAGPFPGAGSPSSAACSGTFAEWSTVWDAIGYTDSGFSGDFFAQHSGLHAPGYDIEMSYNHMTWDSQYEVGALFNDYHVQVVRQVVKSFMDAAALDVQVAYETHAKKTLYIESAYVATNLDDANKGPGGWAANNTADDGFEYSAEHPYNARPAKYWTDMMPFVKDGDKPGVLVGTRASAITKELLAQYDTLVIPGSAINQFVEGTAKSNEVASGKIDTARLQIIKDWVNGGGNLVLTDGALKFFDMAGLTDGSVRSFLGYAGAIDLIRSHDMNKDVRGAARQTVEPVPLGFQVGIHSPIWAINKDAFTKIGGDIAGTGYTGGGSQGTANDVSEGRLKLGAGQIQFLGALLPDPTEEFYHPYGLDDYAPTYSGNQILRNMLGWTEEFSAPPIIITGDGKIEQSLSGPATDAAAPGAGTGPSVDAGKKGTPGPGPELVLLSIVAAGLIFARRRRA